MADSLDDGEFWLPPQILADDDDPHTSPTTKNPDQIPFASSAFHSQRALFPLDFGTFDRFSGFSSSGESLKSSSETESDEEDLVAGLTLRVARSAINDGGFDPDNAKGRVLAGSPQSTLFDMGSGSGCSQGSSRGSPKSNSCKVPSPPATWDLLHAAAGEVAKMRLNDTHGVLHQNRATPQVSVPARNSSAGTGFFLQMQQKEIMQRQKVNHQPVQNRGNRGLPSSSWIPPPKGSGSRTLFPTIPAGKRECAGTGVFLPRSTGNQSEQSRKPGCSTVLVPARVMQALNLNIDDIFRQPHLQSVAAAERLNSENDVLLRLHINRGANNQKRNSRRQPQTDHEIKLPQEWTY